MRLLVSVFFTLFISSTVFGQSSEQKKYNDASEVPRISIEDAKKAFDDGSAVFVDARSPAAYRKGHIKGAINIPASASDDFSSLPKGKKIIVYCS